MRTDVKRFEEFWVTESEIQDERSVVGLAVSSCLVFTGFALVNLTYIDVSYCIRAPSVFFSRCICFVAVGLQRSRHRKPDAVLAVGELHLICCLRQ